jgi:hypothetical protein
MSESSRFTPRCRSESCSGARRPRRRRGRASRRDASLLRMPVLIFRTCLIQSTMSSMPPWLHGAPCGMRTGRPYRYRKPIRLESARSGDNEFGRARAFGSPPGPRRQVARATSGGGSALSLHSPSSSACRSSRSHGRPSPPSRTRSRRSEAAIAFVSTTGRRQGRTPRRFPSSRPEPKR